MEKLREKLLERPLKSTKKNCILRRGGYMIKIIAWIVLFLLLSEVLKEKDKNVQRDRAVKLLPYAFLIIVYTLF